jgi:hypothetical protein
MPRPMFLFTLLLFVTFSLFAQEQTTSKAAPQSVASSALLRAEGRSIRINGVAAPRTMTIFSGDRVETGVDTAAIVILAGRILTLDRNSSAVFRNGTLVLSQGKAWLANQNGSAPVAATRLAPASATAPLTAPLAAAQKLVQGDSGSSNDHFTGICAQFPQACDQAEDACEKENHRDCVCTYKSDHDKDDISPIHPDSDDFKCQPVGNRCKNDDCGD